MKLYIYIIFVLLLSNSMSCAQQVKNRGRYSELKEWAVRGNVKTETLLVFENSGVSDEKMLSTDTAHWKSKVILHYNREGNCERMENIVRLTDGCDTSTTIYAYKGPGRMGITRLKNEITGSSKKMVNGRYYFDSSFDQAGRLILVTTAQLNENFRVVSMEEKYFENEATTTATDHNIVEYSFDPRDHLMKIVSKNKATKQVYISLDVQNLAFDTRGNAIKTLKKNLSGKKRLVLSRWEYFE